MACSCQPPVTTQLGLGRSWPVAFGRTKNISRARPAHRTRDAARAPRGRCAVRQICVFEALAASARRLGRGAAWQRARGRSGWRVAGGRAPAGGAAPHADKGAFALQLHFTKVDDPFYRGKPSLRRSWRKTRTQGAKSGRSTPIVLNPGLIYKYLSPGLIYQSCYFPG